MENEKNTLQEKISFLTEEIDRLEDRLDHLEEKQYRVERKETQSSYEFGAKGNRFKLYFWTIDELTGRLAEITAEGLRE